MAKASKISAVLIAVLVLLGALLLQVGGVRDVKRGDTTSTANPIGLAEKIPFAVSNWTMRDEPLGPTEFVQSEVEKNLNYDDMVNRLYTKGDVQFGVYVAFWSPGRMPVQKVASHTPDRCWSENGWKCLDDRFPEELESYNTPLLPAYWREFSPPAGTAKTYVLYWHLVGGDPYDYGTGFNRMIGPVAWWRETLHYAIKGSAEQYFIRLTSNRPFDGIWTDAGVQEIVQSLAKLGLAAGRERED